MPFRSQSIRSAIQFEAHRRTAPFSEGVGRKEGDRDYPRSDVASQYQHADFLTKALPEREFEVHRGIMMNLM